MADMAQKKYMPIYSYIQTTTQKLLTDSAAAETTVT